MRKAQERDEVAQPSVVQLSLLISPLPPRLGGKLDLSSWRRGGSFLFCSRLSEFDRDEVVTLVGRVDQEEHRVFRRAVVAHFMAHSGRHAAKRTLPQSDLAVALLPLVSNVRASRHADEQIEYPAVQVRLDHAARTEVKNRALLDVVLGQHGLGAAAVTYFAGGGGDVLDDGYG